MSKAKSETGAGAPSFCWVCFKQLQRAPGKGKGLFFFLRVVGADGEQHRIHGDCLADAKAEGAKLIQTEGVPA